eukprot:4004886-Prymnesium_polylepis.1
MATPVQVGEVWDRMVRNLFNCHKQTGDMAQARVVQTLLPREDPAVPAPPVPYPAPDGGATFDEAQMQNPAMLMQMLQTMLQMQHPL